MECRCVRAVRLMYILPSVDLGIQPRPAEDVGSPAVAPSCGREGGGARVEERRCGRGGERRGWVARLEGEKAGGAFENRTGFV